MIRKCAANVANHGIALFASMLFRSAIRPLLEVDERALLTVGLTRADLIECLSTPFTRDPTEMLASRAEAARGPMCRSGVASFNLTPVDLQRRPFPPAQ